MGDEDDRRAFINSNLLSLTKSTTIEAEFVITLFSKGLIGEEHKHFLINTFTPEIVRADKLYTTVANKWSESQFEVFKEILKNTGNLLALQIFTSEGADVFLTSDQILLLRNQRDKSDCGCYEGLSHEDEIVANRIVEIAKGNEMFCEDRKFVLSGDFSGRREVIPLVKKFEEILKSGLIWWNPRKTHLPKNYIERSVAKTNDFDYNGDINLSATATTLVDLVSRDCQQFDSGDDSEVFENRNQVECDLNELVSSFDNDNTITLKTTSAEDSESREHVLVGLVDSPGMGKSSEMSDLENKLRMKVSRNRIVLRINLNEVQVTLKNLSRCESVSSVLHKLAPFIPPKCFQTAGVSVFVILDGLDEVCPKHETTMINLLHVLTARNASEMESYVRVAITMRPHAHLREAVEGEVKVQSWSLLPLTEDEQVRYMSSVLGVSGEQLIELRGKLSASVSDLLRNPLMLNLFVEVVKSEGTFLGGGDLNIFDLYTRFVESKHKLQLVEKEKMGEEDNCTEMRLEGLLERSLPHYYRLALENLIERCAIEDCGGSVVVAKDEPSGVTRDELLSLGLLVEDQRKRLRFKHWSFREFFYARLFFFEASLPQGARDTLFSNICIRGQEMGNVVAFWLGVATSKSKSPSALFGDCETRPSLPSSLAVTLTPKWLLYPRDIRRRYGKLSEFVNSTLLFPLFVREVLLSFVHGDPEDLWEAHKVLLNKEGTYVRAKLFDWMRGNGEWTRKELLNLGEGGVGSSNECPQHKARLMVMIALLCKGQDLLTDEEVGVAVNSINSRLIFIVASLGPEEWRSSVSRWEWVEGRLFTGGSQLWNLFLQMNGEDIAVVLEDLGTTWKMKSLLTREEIYALISNEETRVSDVVGSWPVMVRVALGEEFVPRGKQLAEFRGKFGETKGKTIFEISGGSDFGVETLFGDLVEEMRRGDSDGPVGGAFREALGRLDSFAMGSLLYHLECEVQRGRTRSCHKQKVEERLTEEEDGGRRLMEWVTRGLQWTSSLRFPSFNGLPFLLRYCGGEDTPTLLTTSLQNGKSQLYYSFPVVQVLRSLVIASSFRPHDNDPTPSSLLTSFLKENINDIPPECSLLVESFLGATREEIAAATPPLSLVRDVCVGGVFLDLLATQQKPTTIPKETWEVIVGDIIRSAACCDLPALLQLRQRLEEWSQKQTAEVLISHTVLQTWNWGILPKTETEVACRVRSLLSFYFSILGTNDLSWMRWVNGREEQGDQWSLLKELPVEIAGALRGNPHWSHLLPQFHKFLREYLQFCSIHTLGRLVEVFSYKTEAEWEALLTLIDGRAVLHQILSLNHISDTVDAPLLRALIKLYGVDWTKARLPPLFWEKNPLRVKYTTDSIGPLGSLLHSAIQLGELEEVRKRAFPGLLLSWRNKEGQTALELAMDRYAESHPIRLLLHKLIHSS